MRSLTKLPLIAGAMMAAVSLAACQPEAPQIKLPQTPLEWAHFICDHEPAAYAIIREVDRMSPATEAQVYAAHQTVDAACHPFPTNIAGVIDSLRRAWAVLDPAQQRAQAMREARR